MAHFSPVGPPRTAGDDLLSQAPSRPSEPVSVCSFGRRIPGPAPRREAARRYTTQCTGSPPRLPPRRSPQWTVGASARNPSKDSGFHGSRPAPELPDLPAAAACRGRTTAGTSTYPFCSSRCKWVDLGNWMDARYVIAGPSVEDAELDDETLQALMREPS